jgi:hypothetical protein
MDLDFEVAPYPYIDLSSYIVPRSFSCGNSSNTGDTSKLLSLDGRNSWEIITFYLFNIDV